mgnify:CR=1 FL=1
MKQLEKDKKEQITSSKSPVENTEEEKESSPKQESERKSQIKE